jgi:uncharacterized membrane protein
MSSITVTPHVNAVAAPPMARGAAPGDSHADSIPVRFWVLGRNCSLAPGQTLCALGFVAAVSLAVALFFWFFGATLVLPFALLEVAALATAVVVYSRHAADGERVRIDGRRLTLTCQHGGRAEQFDFEAGSVRVSLGEGADGLIEIRSGARGVSVGAFVRPERRRVLVNEMRAALRHAVA